MQSLCITLYARNGYNSGAHMDAQEALSVKIVGKITGRAKRWELNWERTLETANRVGIALFIAGLLHGIVGETANHRVFFWLGAALIVLSLVRRKAAPALRREPKNT